MNARMEVPSSEDLQVRRAGGGATSLRQKLDMECRSRKQNEALKFTHLDPVSFSKRAIACSQGMSPLAFAAQGKHSSTQSDIGSDEIHFSEQTASPLIDRATQKRESCSATGGQNTMQLDILENAPLGLRIDAACRPPWILAVEPGAPASIAGVKGGDRLLTINSTPVMSLGDDELVALLQQRPLHLKIFQQEEVEPPQATLRALRRQDMAATKIQSLWQGVNTRHHKAQLEKSAKSVQVFYRLRLQLVGRVVDKLKRPGGVASTSSAREMVGHTDSQVQNPPSVCQDSMQTLDSGTESFENDVNFTVSLSRTQSDELWGFGFDLRSGRVVDVLPNSALGRWNADQVATVTGFDLRNGDFVLTVDGLDAAQWWNNSSQAECLQLTLEVCRLDPRYCLQAAGPQPADIKEEEEQIDNAVDDGGNVVDPAA